MGIEYGTIKYKIMIALMLAGTYPYKSLDLMTESPNRKRDAINQLKEEGLIDDKKISGKRRLRLKMFEKRKAKYASDLFDGAENYKPDIRSNGERKLERKDRIAEIIMMMMEAGVNVTPDMKPSPEYEGPLLESEECLPYFITSLEARAAITIKEDKGKGARFHGSLVSLGGMYNVYNMGSVMMEWVRPSEKTAIDFNKQYVRKMVPWGLDMSEWCNNSAIILSRNMEYIIDFVKGNTTPRHGKGSSKNLVNINEYYDKTFYLPLSREGQIMINMMTKRKWHYYLVGMFYKNEHLVSDTVKMSIACDAMKNGCYGLVFMDGDIGRLKRFANVEIKEQDKGKYKVLCYDFQKEIVEKLAPPGMEVVSYDFEKVINAFYQIYEKLEKD